MLTETRRTRELFISPNAIAPRATRWCEMSGRMADLAPRDDQNNQK